MASHNIETTRPNSDATHSILKKEPDNFTSGNDLIGDGETLDATLGSRSKCCTRLWPVFLIVFVIGVILLGTGVFLTVLGYVSFEKDFVIIGSCGIFLGLCFLFVSVYRCFKKVHLKNMDKENSIQRNHIFVLAEETRTSSPVYKRGILKSIQLQKFTNNVKRVYFNTDKVELETDANVVLLKHVSIDDLCNGNCVCCRVARDHCNGRCNCCKLTKSQCNGKCVCCKQVADTKSEVNNESPNKKTFNRQKGALQSESLPTAELKIFNHNKLHKQTHVEILVKREKEKVLSKSVPNNSQCVLSNTPSSKRKTSEQKQTSNDNQSRHVTSSGQLAHPSQGSSNSHTENLIPKQPATKLSPQSHNFLPRDHSSKDVAIKQSHHSMNYHIDIHVPSSHSSANQHIDLPSSHSSANQHIDIPLDNSSANQHIDPPVNSPSINHLIDLPPSPSSFIQSQIPSKDSNINVKSKPQLKLAIRATNQSESYPANKVTMVNPETVPLVLPTDTRLLQKRVHTLAEVCLYNTNTNFCDSGKSSIDSDSILDYEAPQKGFTEVIPLNLPDSFVFDFTQQTQKKISSSDVIMRAIPSSDIACKWRPLVGMSELDDRIEILDD